MSKQRVEEGAGNKFDLQDRLVAFAAAVCLIAEELPSTRVGNHAGSQLIRSGTAVASNYGEAQGAESRKDFVHKMKICFKELRETQVWLKFLQKLNLGPEDEVESGVLEADELIAIFYTSLETARRNLKAVT